VSGKLDYLPRLNWKKPGIQEAAVFVTFAGSIIAILIWSRLLLVTDWPRVAVCAVPPASTNAIASWHAGGCA